MVILHSPYEGYKIAKKYFRKDRWYVRLEKPNGRTESLPHANYNWLVGNPAFPGIPKGYVIHHLDKDPLNDDISNLALMSKNHHRAYHLKYKNNNIPVELDCGLENLSTMGGLPTRKPRAFYEKDRGRWRIFYRIPIDGRIKTFSLSKYKDKYFYNKAQAEQAIEEIWPGLTDLKE